MPYIKGKANIKLPLCTSWRNTEILVCSIPMHSEMLWQQRQPGIFTVTLSGFILQFGKLLYGNGTLVQHPDDGRKSDRNTKVNFIKR